MATTIDDDKKDELEEMDEADGDSEDGDIDPDKLKGTGLHIEGEDDVAEVAVETEDDKEALLEDLLRPKAEIPEADDEEEVELEDEEYADPTEF